MQQSERDVCPDNEVALLVHSERWCPQADVVVYMPGHGGRDVPVGNHAHAEMLESRLPAEV